MGEAIGWGLLLVVGAVLGLAAYEVLTRLWAPKSHPALALESKASSASSQGSGMAHGLKRRRFENTFAALSERLEQFAPLARSDFEACRDRLERAGLAIAPETWRSLRVVSTAAGGLVGGALFVGGTFVPVGLRIAVLCCGVLAGWLLPALLLSSREKQRKLALEMRLPDAMELLGIAIAAGSPVEQCFREVAASMDGPLADEFALVDQEVNLLGHTRETALENLGRRCRSPEISAFVAQLIQAVSQGTSIAESLASQAKLSREMAQADALERIRKMPTKLDVVLSLCFLPPTVVLVIVPTVVNLLQFLNDSMA